MELRRSLRFLAVTALISVVCGCNSGSSGSSGTVSSSRDNLSIWTIEGRDLEEIFEVMGYNVASDRLWQLEVNRRTARGELAAIFGESQVESDIFVRTTGYTEAELQTGFDTLDPEPRSLLDAYAAGINRRIAEVALSPELRPAEFDAFGINPGTWTSRDVLAAMVYTLRTVDAEALYTGQITNAALLQDLVAKFPLDGMDMFEDLRWQNDSGARSVIPQSPTPTAASIDPAPIPDPDSFPPLSDTARRLQERMQRIRDGYAEIGVLRKGGSYGWAVAGGRTEDANSLLYGGPFLGFDAPAAMVEGAIRGGGLDVAGMSIPGIPGFLVGRNRGVAWTIQTGHGHTVDYYLDDPSDAELVRTENIQVKDGDSVTLEVYETIHGPVIEPIPFNPLEPVITWKYAHRTVELRAINTLLAMWRGESIQEFGDALLGLPASLQVTVAGNDGQIAHYMTGRDPVRDEEVDPRFVQLGDGTQEWPSPLELKPRPESLTPPSGWFGGWNDKVSPGALNSPNNDFMQFGPFRRGHLIAEALASNNGFYIFPELRDIALDVATTDGIGIGGNPYAFVEDALIAAVNSDPTPERAMALELLASFDGHFVEGGREAWVTAELRSDAWVLQDAWIREVLKLVFEDELETASFTWEDQRPEILFNVLLHALDGPSSGVVNNWDWFEDTNGRGIPTDVNGVFNLALDNALEALGERPYEVERGVISFQHPVYEEVATSPFFNRATYSQIVVVGRQKPERIETSAPLGQSGFITMGEFDPVFGEDFFTRQPTFDAFEYSRLR